MHALDAGLVLNALSGVLMVGLGVFVAFVGGRRSVNRAFALFAIPFGIAWIVDNLLLAAEHAVSTANVIRGADLLIAAVGLATLACLYPRPVTRDDRTRLVAAATTGAAVFAAHFWFPYALLGGFAWTNNFLPRVGFIAFHAVAWAVLVLFALRHAALANTDPRSAGALRLMSAALVLYPAYFIARNTVSRLALTEEPTALTLAGFVLIVAMPLLVAGLWLWNAARTTSPAWERRIAWMTMGAALLGVPSFGFAINNPGYGIARTIGVVILAYAIVRHQLLGIDVKLRFALSKSTVAAVFIAVFFIASELAQQFFGERLGGPYVGILAAGGLVFAIAPLSRFADRLAEKAVPVSSPAMNVAPAAANDREESFRRAVRLALRDRTVTRQEERDLFELAHHLGISPLNAGRIQDEIQAESLLKRRARGERPRA